VIVENLPWMVSHKPRSKGERMAMSNINGAVTGLRCPWVRQPRQSMAMVRGPMHVRLLVSCLNTLYLCYLCSFAPSTSLSALSQCTQ
jgi:hypothetical protein